MITTSKCIEAFISNLDPIYLDTYSSFVTQLDTVSGLIVRYVALTISLICFLRIFSIKQLKQRVVSLQCDSGHDNRDVPQGGDLEKNLYQWIIDKETFFTLLLDSTSEAMCGFDMEWRCVFVNRSFIEMFKLHKCENVIGFNVHDMIHYKRPDESFYHCHECRILNSSEWKASKVFFGEECFVRSDGIWLVGECWVSPIKHQGSTIGGVLSIIDISEKKRVEEEKNALKGDLEESRKFESVGKHVCDITHDFSNVLMGIRCYTDLALEEINNHTDNREYLKNVIKATEKANLLIQEIRMFSKPNTRKQELFDIVNTTKDVLRILRGTVPEKTKIEEGYAMEECMMFGRQIEIFRAVLNICKNSIHAMKSVKDGVLNVQLYENNLQETQELIGHRSNVFPSAHCVLKIADNGTGMPEDIKEKIFEPYFTTKELLGGTGLGLSIVDSVVREHSGHILVDSTEGAGTCFKLFFPCKKAVLR